MIQILIIASAIVALVIGIPAFGPGIQVGGKSRGRWKGRGAKIVGAICIIYACCALLGVVAIFINVALDS